MDRTKSLKILLKVREHRTLGLQDAVDQAVASRDKADRSKFAAQEAVQEALAAEACERDRLASLTCAGKTFDITTLLQRQHVAELKKAAVMQKQQDVERCDATLNERLVDVRTRRNVLAKHRQKIDALGEDIAKLKAQRQQEEDDQQDEESEETAISRMRPAQLADSPRGTRR